MNPIECLHQEQNIRLTPLAHKLGVLGSEERLASVNKKVEGAKEIKKYFEKVSITKDQVNDYLTSKGSAKLKQTRKLRSLLVRPHITIKDLQEILPDVKAFLANYPAELVESAEINN